MIWYSVEVCAPRTCNGQNGDGSPANHGPGEACNASQRAGIECVTKWLPVTILDGGCSGGGGGDTGYPLDGGNSDLPPGGGGGNDMITIGIVPNDGLVPVTIATPFFNNLPVVLRNFIQSTAQNQLRAQIENYLITNNFSPKALGFAAVVIKAKKESNNAEIDYENLLIYDDSVPECLKTIINKLKPTEGFDVSFAGVDNRLLQQLQLPNMILDLFNNDAGYSLKIEAANLTPDPISGLIPNAQTSNLAPSTVPAGDVFNITISIDNSYLSAATDLAVARTMIHELTHAYLSYLLRSQPQGNIAQQLQRLLQNATANVSEHDIMANHFVDTLANALGVWDDFSIPINSNNGTEFDGTPFDYYELLSWSGELTTTTYYRNSKSANFSMYSIASQKAEAGSNGLEDVFILFPKGTNNCNE